MALSAVIFDYGMVLTDGQNAAVHAELIAMTGLDREQFEPLYWERRHEYDLGHLTGLAFWEAFLLKAGLGVNPELAARLNYCDARMWTSVNPEMLAWQQAIRQRWLKTADSVSLNGDRTYIPAYIFFGPLGILVLVIFFIVREIRVIRARAYMRRFGPPPGV